MGSAVELSQPELLVIKGVMHGLLLLVGIGIAIPITLIEAFCNAKKPLWDRVARTDRQEMPLSAYHAIIGPKGKDIFI